MSLEGAESMAVKTQEYAAEIGTDLLTAYSRKDHFAAVSVFEKADRHFRNNNIDAATQRLVWNQIWA